MKRLCSLLLVIGICFTFLPVSVFAEEQGEITERETISGGGKSDAKQETTQTGFTPVCNDGVLETAAKAEVEAMVNSNEAVKHFETSNLKEATMEQRTQVVSALQEETTDTTAQASLAAISDDALFHYVSVEATSATVTKDTSSAGVVVKTMSFEVKPMVSATVAASNGMKTVTAEIPNAAISSPITFRLPISSGVATGTIVDVNHEGTYFVSCSVQEENGGKYIELSSTSFSTFSFTLTEITVAGVQSGLAGGYSLNIRDSTNIDFRVKEIASGTEKKDYTLKYSFAGGETKVVNLADYIKGDDSPYITVAECTSRQYTQVASVDIFYKGVSVRHLGLSVESYCASMIDSSQSDKNLKGLCEKLLDFGYYAQEWFGDSSQMPSDRYRANAAATATIPEFGHEATEKIDAVSARGIFLDLRSYVSLDYNITLTNTDTPVADVFQVGLDGKTYTPISPTGSPVTLNISRTKGTESLSIPCTVTLSETDTPGKYQIEISKIPFVCLDQMFYLKTEQGGQTMTVAYSPMEYCYLCQKENYGTLLKALYNYYSASKTYFGIGN